MTTPVTTSLTSLVDEKINNSITNDEIDSNYPIFCINDHSTPSPEIEKKSISNEKNTKHNVFIQSVPLIAFVMSGFSNSVETQSFIIKTKETFFGDYVIDEYTIEWFVKYVDIFGALSKCASITITQTESFDLRYAIWMRKKNGSRHWIYIDKLKEHNKDFVDMFDFLEFKMKHYVSP